MTLPADTPMANPESRPAGETWAQDPRHGPLPLLLIVLTVVTGLVDAVSYLRLGHVFVANMTGNVVFLGFSVDPHSGLSAVASLGAIAAFALGALGGGRVANTLARTGAGRWLATALAAEAVMLGLVAALTGTGVLPFTGHGNLVTIAVLAAALGVQNSTVRH